MDKAELRKRMNSARNMLDERQVKTLSDRIFQRLCSAIDWHSVARVHIYQTRTDWNEVQTDQLIDFIQADWPSIELIIAEPVKTAVQPKGKFDVIVVPLLAFDDECNRLGRGGGWYDRFLANQLSARTIGLAYEIQKVDHLPIEPHDVPLTNVITERRVYPT